MADEEEVYQRLISCAAAFIAAESANMKRKPTKIPPSSKAHVQRLKQELVKEMVRGQAGKLWVNPDTIASQAEAIAKATLKSSPKKK